MTGIAVLGLGGTIASRVAPGAAGAAPDASVDELLAELGVAVDGVRMHGRQLLQVASSDLGITAVLEVAVAILHEFADGADGVVIAQGTDTIEESAFLLDLVLDPALGPVVVTGAMRHPGIAGSDAAANLRAAVATAASPAAAGLGVLVVMHDEIHSAAFVRKAHTSSPSAFASSPVGPVGWIAEGVPVIPVRPVDRRAPLLVAADAAIPDVPIVAVAFGDSGTALRAIAASAIDGLVVEALGGGHVPSSLVPEIAAVAARIPVVIASRTGAGAVLERTYAFAGSERSLLAAGAIPAGILPASKARVLLSLLIAAGEPRERIERAVREAGRSTTNPTPSEGVS